MALFCCPKPDDDLKYKEQEESIWAIDSYKKTSRRRSFEIVMWGKIF